MEKRSTIICSRLFWSAIRGLGNRISYLDSREMSSCSTPNPLLGLNSLRARFRSLSISKDYSNFLILLIKLDSGLVRNIYKKKKSTSEFSNSVSRVIAFYFFVLFLIKDIMLRFDLEGIPNQWFGKFFASWTFQVCLLFAIGKTKKRKTIFILF